MTRVAGPAAPLAALLAVLLLAGCSGDVKVGPPTPGTSTSLR
ncbi:MAG: hypothetical protein VYD87_22295 [Pseudomonadota bacterium]|nr:hypothetical protein [Pseudomonadota bacterium]MEE3099907.1 hypothetical protein [Pseudomonadota bacterium]